MTVTLGGYSETVYGVDFVRTDEGFLYKGEFGGITRVKIRDDGRFSVKARGVDLSSLSLDSPVNPVSFSLEIGGYLGTKEIAFGRNGRFWKNKSRANRTKIRIAKLPVSK